LTIGPIAMTGTKVTGSGPMQAEGVSQREIAARLGIHRRTVRRMLEADEPPRYRRSPQGSKLDPFEAVLVEVLEECPAVKAPRMTDILRARL
jgi:transposase